MKTSLEFHNVCGETNNSAAWAAKSGIVLTASQERAGENGFCWKYRSTALEEKYRGKLNFQ